MSRALRVEYPGAVYHVMSRGNARSSVFLDDEDRVVFLNILSRVVVRWRWIVHAYCLMGNHYHLLLETLEPNLSRGMRHLNGEYSQAFNRIHGRCGHVFQGRFHSLVVEKQSHLLELCRYIVLNPLRVRGMKVARPEDWKWSSYLATAGLAPAPDCLDTSWVLKQFGGTREKRREAYRLFVAAGAGLGKAGWPEIQRGLWVGSEEFGKILSGALELKRDGREYRVAERMALRPPLESFFPDGVRDDRIKRDDAIHRAYSEARYTQREIGDHLGLHYVTISVIVRREERLRRERR
jgi:putative transposase